MRDAPLWVFAYGSLLWNPGFEVSEKIPARAAGYHRSFCMWSIHHRGTEEQPGLVLALDAAEGAVCDGVALRASPGTEAQTLAYLRERELISSAYRETALPLRLKDGRAVQSVAYVVDRDHIQYTGPLALERQAVVIAGAIGGRGPNRDYLFNTAEHLAELGIVDDDMEWLVQRVRDLRATE